MMNLMAMLLTAFLSACGCFALFYWLIGALLSEKEDVFYVLLPLRGEAEAAEIQIKAARFYLKRMGGKQHKKIIVLDNGMSAGAKQIVRMEAAEDENILLMELNELQNLS